MMFLVLQLTQEEEELKAIIRDAVEARNITVYDERRWSETVGQPRGVHWVLEAVTETSHVNSTGVRKGIERCAREQ